MFVSDVDVARMDYSTQLLEFNHALSKSVGFTCFKT